MIAETVRLASLKFERFYTPLLCVVGIIGNILSLLVFCLEPNYRKQTPSYYLSALAISDTGYLLNLFAIWLESIHGFVITSDYACPVVMYFGQVTCFLSIYLIVVFSAERYIAVYKPLEKLTVCTPSRAKRIILVLCSVALLLYSYTLVIARVIEIPLENGEDEIVHRCSVPDEYYKIALITNHLDGIVTLVIPVITIFVLNVRISRRLRVLSIQRRHLTETGRSSKSSTSRNYKDTALEGSGNPGNDCEDPHEIELVHLPTQSDSRMETSDEDSHHSDAGETGSTADDKSTKPLILVSTVFLLLNAPLHCIRVGHFIHNWKQDLATIGYDTFIENATHVDSGEFMEILSEESNVETETTHLWLQSIVLWANMLFNANFAVNFLLYCLSGKNFRKTLREIICHFSIRRFGG